MNQEALVKQLVQSWPSAVVARKSAGKFSGGVVSPRTLANVDSMGTGPDGRFMIGRSVVYPAESLARWIARQMKERAA